MSVCHMHAWYPSKAEESDPLTGVQMVVSNYVGAGNQTQIFWKNTKMLLISEPSLQCPLSNFFNFQIPAEMN